MMKTYLKRALAMLLAIAMLFIGGIVAFARTPAQARNDVLAYLTANVTVPTVSAVGGEWAVLALARGGANVPVGYYDDYINRVRQILNNNNGVLPGPVTEHARVVIALSALGIDVTNIDGRNLLMPLANFDNVTAQGINGAAFALVALDTRGWAIPAIANSAAQTTRQRLVEFILSREISGGGFALGAATTPGADVTAMVLQSLVPYRSQAAVAAVIDRALAVLPQLPVQTAESAAQVVIALSSWGLSSENALNTLLALQRLNGSFVHAASGAGNHQMATEQAALALVAHQRAVSGQHILFDMQDVPARALPQQTMSVFQLLLQVIQWIVGVITWLIVR